MPCWVKDLDDDEAFMQLVLANTQGELSPIEIGMHALKAVALAEGGRGKHGGLSEYADRIGWTKAYVGQLRSAAEVAETVNSSIRFDLSEKAKHLYEISRSPRQAWPLLTGRLLAKGWTVAETSSTVEKVRKFDIPAEHAEWLPYAAVVEACRGARTAPVVKAGGDALMLVCDSTGKVVGVCDPAAITPVTSLDAVAKARLGGRRDARP